MKKIMLAAVLFAGASSAMAATTPLKLEIKAGGQNVEAIQTAKFFEGYTMSKTSFTADVIQNAQNVQQEVPGAFSKELTLRADIVEDKGKTAKLQLILAHDAVKMSSYSLDGINFIKPLYHKCQFNEEVTLSLNKPQRLGKDDCKFEIVLRKQM